MDRPYFVSTITAVLFSLSVCWLNEGACAERTALKSGKEEEGSLVHSGTERTFLVYLPPQYNASTPAPVVFFFHGGGGNAAQGMKAYAWNKKSDAEGFIVVYSNGTGRGKLLTWNAMHGCGYAFQNQTDDVGFVKALIEHLQKKYSVDSKRIYVTGMSNGGMLTHRLAAELSPLIAAAAPVAGTIGGQEHALANEKRPPAPEKPVPMIIFHGKQDENVAYEGGRSKGIESRRIDLSVTESVKFWATANGCANPPTSELLDNGSVIKDTYASPTGADVVLYSLVEGGHSWPGSVRKRGTISATDLAWEFFKNHPRQ